MKTKVSGVKDIPEWVDSGLNIANEMNSELEDIEYKLPKMRHRDIKKN